MPIHSPNSAPPNRSIKRSKPRTDARVSHLSEGDSDDRRRAGLRALSRPHKMGTSARVPSIAALLGIVLIWSIASTALAVAHESWINRGGYRNSAGEWCCGENDCESPGQIAVTGKGWVIGGKEFVPFEEATPSPDGKIWICRRPDHTRRCVFGPPPGS